MASWANWAAAAPQLMLATFGYVMEVSLWIYSVTSVLLKIKNFSNVVFTKRTQFFPHTFSTLGMVKNVVINLYNFFIDVLVCYRYYSFTVGCFLKRGGVPFFFFLHFPQVNKKYEFSLKNNLLCYDIFFNKSWQSTNVDPYII
jgi:hypothetical protein